MPIGIALTELVPSDPQTGIIEYFGVIPEYRNLKIGRSLHLKSLQTLIGLGAKTYLGSTNIRNYPMIKIFDVNECEVKGVRRTWRRA